MSLRFDENWFPTPTDPEWSDLTPIPLTEEDQKFVSIPGTAQYQAIMSYLRALLAAKEYSGRGLRLTDIAIQCLPSNYTVWHYRRLCLDAVGGDWDDELQEMVEVSKDNPKTYQVWQFRKTCTSKLNHPRSELSATEEYILSDQKNYHVWGYRQWLLRNFPAVLSHQLSQKSTTQSTATKFSTVNEELLTYLATTSGSQLDYSRLSDLTIDQFHAIPLALLPIWGHELRFCNQLLFTDPDCDIRNNSAWNQRMFVLGFAFSLSAPHPAQLPEQTASSLPHSTISKLITTSFRSTWVNEIKTVIDSFITVARNESAYNYLHGLCALHYKTKPDPALPTTLQPISSTTDIVSPALELVYPVIVALGKFTLTKQTADLPSATSFPNRFFLSFLVDFLLVLIKTQSPLLFSQQLEEISFDTTRFETVTAEQLREITAALAAQLDQQQAQQSPQLPDQTKLVTKSILKQVVQATVELTNADPLRAKYWTFRNVQVQKRYQAELV